MCWRSARTPTGTHDAAIFAVLYIGGIRRSELAGLALTDWTPAPPTLRVRHGKGDKERLVPLVGGAARGPSGRPVAQTGRISGARLSSNAIYKTHPVISWLTHIDPEHGRIIVNTSLDFGTSAQMSPGQLADVLPP